MNNKYNYQTRERKCLTHATTWIQTPLSEKGKGKYDNKKNLHALVKYIIAKISLKKSISLLFNFDLCQDS